MMHRLWPNYDRRLGRLLLSVSFLGILALGWLLLPSLGLIAAAQGSPLHEALLQEGQKHQVIQFNPDAALQKRIFADKFVPNSSEFSLTVAGSDYAAQRAENLGTGLVRVYYVRGGDWGNVQFTQGDGELGDALVAEAQRKQVIQFNPGAALQKAMFSDGFVPNSSEFQAQVDGVTYSAQRAENLGSGEVRVYYVANGDWGNVRNTGQATPAPQILAPVVPAPPPVAPPVVQPAPQPSTGGGRVAPIGKDCPASAPIKGNRNSKGEWIYHMPGQQAYKITEPEDCFATPEQARAAGYRAAQR